MARAYRRPMPIVIRQNDPALAAIKAELLHAVPELTGKQINAAAMVALVTIMRRSESAALSEG